MRDQDKAIVQVPEWQQNAWLRHGFSTRRGGVSTVYLPQSDDAPSWSRSDGDLNLGLTKDDPPANVTENRRRLVAAVTEAGNVESLPPLIALRQVHSNKVLTFPLDSTEAISSFVDANGRALLEADGLISRSTGVLLGVQTADCVPVLVVDTRQRVVAAFHAGWRGTAARIVELGVARMKDDFQSRPEDLTAAIGPSIGACCYTVGEPVYEEFTSGFTYGQVLFRKNRGSRGLCLDLWEANRRQLLASGVPAPCIHMIAECTGCAGLRAGEEGLRRYFSHRCEHGFTGRMMSVIGVVS